jgi:hypothetical protein
MSGPTRGDEKILRRLVWMDAAATAIFAPILFLVTADHLSPFLPGGVRAVLLAAAMASWGWVLASHLNRRKMKRLLGVTQ